MIEVTEEMIEAGAKTIWSQGTRGLFERKQHISNILDAALAATATRTPLPPAVTESELVEDGAQAAYEHWQNIPACIASKSWAENCEKLPGSAKFFRDLASKVLSARAALKQEGE